ncbi:unnamed protein product [Darwinula stevensoni]|uniref:Histidine triad nucleotide binding protein 3 n=1 Tax=Darwinula stevensoni TaxID=69355 RepID=A0A7R8X4T3_9CRUS|nr:unnamed protein product [Darwinula stevensoni]CAG0879383.1 unnamed protein product [Darwinula stevensoni]
MKQGFHWPPFHSVAHLHLHIISPKAPMSWLSRMIFRDSSPCQTERYGKLKLGMNVTTERLS